MSYGSEHIISRKISLTDANEVALLLGYKPAKNFLKIPDLKKCYYWYDATDYKSWSGVELDIYIKRSKSVICTRSAAARSYWDLMQQNKTIRLFHKVFGGSFVTDAGKNRCWRIHTPPPSPLASGCELAYSRFSSAITKIEIYLSSREMKHNLAVNGKSHFSLIDSHNPLLLSNNMVVPYLVGVFEEFFRSTFSAILKYSKQKDRIFKKVNLQYSQLEQIALGYQSVEDAVAASFYFQRPSRIVEYFKYLDPKLDIYAELNRPFRRRKRTLYESIESIIEDRNSLVHTGDINLDLDNVRLNTVVTDITEAIKRVYILLVKHYHLTK